MQNQHLQSTIQQRRVVTNLGIKIQLLEENLSRALEYIFTVTTAEVIKFNDKDWIKQNRDLKEGILIRRGRIVERQRLKVAGGAEKFIDLGELTGVNYAVPVLDRFTPWAVSFAQHIHYKVKESKHRAASACHKISLSKVY